MKRILGDLRIFQAIHNDLKLLHKPEDHAYIYPGVDPYELEDSAFPTITKAVTAARREAYEKALNYSYNQIEKLVPYMNFLERARHIQEDLATLEAEQTGESEVE